MKRLIVTRTIRETVSYLVEDEYAEQLQAGEPLSEVLSAANWPDEKSEEVHSEGIDELDIEDMDAPPLSPPIFHRAYS